MAFFFLSFLFFFLPTSAVNYLHERRGEGRRGAALNRFVRIYPAIPLSLLLSRCGYTAGNIGRITGNQPSSPSPRSSRRFTPSPRNFQSPSLPRSPPSGGVEFHGIPLILGEINIDTGGLAVRRWCNYFMVHFYFYFFFLFFFFQGYQTGAVLIIILVDFARFFLIDIINYLNK